MQKWKSFIFLMKTSFGDLKQIASSKMQQKSASLLNCLSQHCSLSCENMHFAPTELEMVQALLKGIFSCVTPFTFISEKNYLTWLDELDERYNNFNEQKNNSLPKREKKLLYSDKSFDNEIKKPCLFSLHRFLSWCIKISL